jgi:hypothetical protein
MTVKFAREKRRIVQGLDPNTGEPMDADAIEFWKSVRSYDAETRFAARMMIAITFGLALVISAILAVLS